MKDCKPVVFRYLAVAIITFLPIGTTSAQSLQEAVVTALQTYPEVKALDYGSMAARNIQAQAFAGYLPSLDLQAFSGYENSNNPATRARIGGDEDLTPSGISLGLNLNLFEGFGSRARVASSANFAKIAALRVKEAAERLGLQISQVYIDVLLYQELVALAKNNIDDHQNLLDLVKQRVAQQVGSQSDESQVLSRLKAAQASLKQYEGLLADAKAAFKTKTDSEPADLTIPPLDDLVAANLAEDIKLALNSNPNLEQARANIAMAKADHLQKKSAYYPRVNLELSTNHNSDMAGTPDRNASMSGMVTLTQNLFAGGQNYYEVQKAYNMLRQAESELEQAEREIGEYVKVVYNGWLIARSRKKTFEAQVADNKLVKEAFSQQFTVNKRTLLDLLDSENTLLASRTNHAKERFLEILEVYRLLSLQGRLLEELQIEMPEGAKFKKMTLVDTISYKN